MKNLKLILASLFLSTLIFQSCEDFETVTAPSFLVTPVTVNAKAGEIVEFKVENAPNYLTFYSGEFGQEYKNRNRVKAEGTYTLSFETARNYQNGTSGSDDPWSLLMSTDYTGSGEVADVEAATWTDISDRFTFSTARTFAKTHSGTVDITDLATDKAVYFALRAYTEGKVSEGNRQGTFRVSSFDIILDVTGEDYSFDIASLATPGFKPVNVKGTNPTRPETYDFWRDLVGTKGYYELHGGKANYTNDDWLISNPISLAGTIAPDRPESLKSYSKPLQSFLHTYSKAGTYTVTLVGSNTTIYDSKQSIQELTITVTD